MLDYSRITRHYSYKPMKYLLDTNSLSNEILKLASKRDDFFVVRDVLDELPQTIEERRKLTSSGVKILEVNNKHLKKLTDVMGKYGDNFSLIGLYMGEGTADVLMLAYILAERELEGDKLFPEKWIIVTEDRELIKIAKENDITSISKIDLLKLAQ